MTYIFLSSALVCVRGTELVLGASAEVGGTTSEGEQEVCGSRFYVLVFVVSAMRTDSCRHGTCTLASVTQHEGADVWPIFCCYSHGRKSSWKRKGVNIWKPACSTEQRAVTFFFFFFFWCCRNSFELDNHGFSLFLLTER